MNHHTTRRVWALITAEPQLTTQEIAGCLGLRAKSTISHHLKKLERAGYITQEYHRGKPCPRTRRVLVPFHGGPVTIRTIKTIRLTTQECAQ